MTGITSLASGAPVVAISDAFRSTLRAKTHGGDRDRISRAQRRMDNAGKPRKDITMNQIIAERKAGVLQSKANMKTADEALQDWFTRKGAADARLKAARAAEGLTLDAYQTALVKYNEGLVYAPARDAARADWLKASQRSKAVQAEIDKLLEEKQQIDQDSAAVGTGVQSATRALWEAISAAEIERLGETIKDQVLALYGCHCRTAVPGGAPLEFTRFLDAFFGRKLTEQASYVQTALTYTDAVATSYGLEVAP